ncbi:hypothetical protein [Algoriphagus litoralis]|uniref:hypothetical protein n=1 Tax=Algoriphagus litoralis TaxID=2202829 RepID=UPI000DBA7B73|nr:hypothetical protein [Algoriphagus litoralis]
MDLGNIVYIVAVLAYFIYQATRKKKGQEMTDSDDAPEAPQKGMTFEDLMREIRQAQNPTAEKPEPVRPKPEVQEPVRPQPYRNQPVPSHIPQAQKASRKPLPVEDDEEIQYYEGTYEASKKSPYENYKEEQTAPMLSSIKMDYDSLQEKKINPYAQLLKNPKTLREAIIVSEILKPKHF